MRYNFARTIAFAAVLLAAPHCPAEVTSSTAEKAERVKVMARELMAKGFTAGSGYDEIWIRDYATFIRLALDVHSSETVKGHLRTFLQLQQPDGAIVDGYVRRDDHHGSNPGYKYLYSALAPEYAGHKNTVETDQESSLVHAVDAYVDVTGDAAFLEEMIGEYTVRQRLARAMEFLLAHRYDAGRGLLWGATTADWGDVQPEHPLGVELDESSHRAIDIYDNAMFMVALDGMMRLDAEGRDRWRDVRGKIATNVIRHLWDDERQKFRPHVYLDGSPFGPGLDEDAIYYHGGTAVAMQAGLLNSAQIRTCLQAMRDNVKRAGAASIGLTVYPAYPAGSFKNPIMAPYHYQNGGDWTWFGGRMVRELARNGLVEEAKQELAPMVDRVIKNGDFYEWYNLANEPKGSPNYRGSAGVLYEAIGAIEDAEGNGDRPQRLGDPGRLNGGVTEHPYLQAGHP